MNIHDTFARLRRLAREIESLPVDWPRFAALAEQAGPASPSDELAVLGRLLVGAGLRRADGKRAAGLLVRLASAEAAMASASPQDFAELLRDLAAAGDAEGLALALTFSPHDGTAYVTALRKLADSMGPETKVDAATVRAEQVRAIMDHPKPGRVVTEELAGAIVDAVTAWHQLKNETPEQRAIREAFAEARRLVDTLGEEDPRAFAAIVRAVELQDPGFGARMLKADGITLPTPTHCAEDGTPLVSLEAVADALGADLEDLEAIAEEMEAAGMTLRRQPAGVIH